MGASYTVTITSQPYPLSTCADAVRFSYLGDVGDYYVAIGDSITVANEGVSGTNSADGAASISVILSRHPAANYYLVLYGSNDALIPAVPSDKGLRIGDPGYSGSYKDNMQRIITAILASGKTPYLAKVPYTSRTDRSLSSIQDFNEVVDELVAANGISLTPPDFYTYFQANLFKLADGLHPSGTGYQSMADIWLNTLTTP